jgi:hypothetical protein
VSRNARAGSIPAPGTFKKFIYIYNKQTNLLIMKKLTMILAAVALMFTVVSCGSKSTTEETVVADSVEVVEAPATEGEATVEEVVEAEQGEAIQ